MKEKQKSILARIAAVGSYALMAGAAYRRGRKREEPTQPVKKEGLLRGLKNKLGRWETELEIKEALERPIAPPGTELGDVPPTGPEWQDLSLTTHGNMELDRLTRIAATDEHEREQGQETLPPPFGESGLAWTSDSPIVADVLARQDLQSPRLIGWSDPRPRDLPLPTYVPAIMAFGIVLFAMGLVTSFYVCIAGACVFAISAFRWTGILQGE